MVLTTFGEIKDINREHKNVCGWVNLSPYNYISGYMIPQDDYEIKLFDNYFEAKEYIHKTYEIRIPMLCAKLADSNVDRLGDFEKVECDSKNFVRFYNRYNYCRGMGVNLIDVRKINSQYDSRMELVAFRTM